MTSVHSRNKQQVDETNTVLSLVIPLYNETEILPQLIERLENALKDIDLKTELVLVDDGSTDTTWLEMKNITPRLFDLKCIALSRNFGKEAALTSGLLQACGEAVIILDADGQDPPEMIPKMIEAWRDGADVVNMQRLTRQGESWMKRLSASLFYYILEKLSDTRMLRNVGDFRLLSRRVLDQVNQLGERNRYMKGLLTWPGFNQVTLPYYREARSAGNSKWNFWSLFFLALSGVTAFSNKPLRLASWLGALVASSSFLFGLWIVIRTLLYGDPVAGYPSMMVVILFMGGVQLITIGILGEYVGRIFTEVKGRPNFIIRECETRRCHAGAVVKRDLGD